MAEWQVPPLGASETTRLGWHNECTEEGLAWFRSQRGTSDIKKALEILAGKGDIAGIPQYRSKLNTNRLKRDIREMVGSLANIRPIWGYASDNNAFKAQAEMMNKSCRAIYLEQFFDRSIKEALQYAAATCTGWLRPLYRRDMYGTGKGNLRLESYGSPCVLPVQLPRNNDWQNAYAVTLLDEVPIAMAHGMFPAFQDRLRPTTSRYWYSADVRKAAQANMFKRIWGSVTGGRAEEAMMSDLFCPIRYTWIIDLSLNQTGQMIPMGEFGSSWYYEVPSLGQDIPAGRDSRGNQIFRKATENDARMYPYRRLMISGETCVLYDGPAFDWHGHLPLIPICVDDWPWEPIGFSLVRDGYDLQEAINTLTRGIMDKHAAQLDMALGYDINAVAKKEADGFDPMQPRARIGFDGSMVDKPFAPVVPDSVLQVDAATPVFISKLEGDLDYQLGVNQAVQLAKARVMASRLDENALDALAEGPLVMDIGRSMERSMAEIGYQLKFLVPQYYDTARIMQFVGADGVTRETFDYDPTSLVPSHMPGENVDEPSQSPIVHRGRVFAENLRFFVNPHSVHEMTQMSQKLMLIQIRKAGVGIDDQTIAEAANIPNYGEISGSTVRERWAHQQEEMLEQQIRMKAIAESLGIQPPQPPGGGGGVPPPGAPKAPEGRPPTFSAAPALEVKDQGARSTITTSKH